MIGRRRFLFSTTILAAVGTATFGWAADAKDAEVLVTNLVADINAVISSGSSESVMVRQFENIFKSYADVPTIARYALGNDARARCPRTGLAQKLQILSKQEHLLLLVDQIRVVHAGAPLVQKLQRRTCSVH